VPTDIERLSQALIGRYEIVRELGAGGMAMVYLARDARHDRHVALKVLRPELSAILGGDRFLTEIKTTANLQHPHILSLFDSGEADGIVYYVMPYVEGESVRDRLTREKQLPVDEAVRIACEVAGALQYAHEHGVVHRDIKPENILLHGGHAMVADFGIALAASRSDGGTRMTETGMSLGTPHYMAPEQAMGEREITPKADIYALGCVLYEMLTAEPPFTGATAQAIIARVMTEEPRSLTLQRRTIPPHVEAAVRKALEKLPADRFASAAEFATALVTPGMLASTSARAAGDASQRGGRRVPVIAAAGAALALAAVGLVLGRATAPRPAPALEQFSVPLPDSTSFGQCCSPGLTLTPDGSRLVFVAAQGSGTRLYSRQVGRLESEPIPGTDGAIGPFASPDGRWIGFQVDTRLVKVSLSGGPPIKIAELGSIGMEGASWGDNDTIVFGGLEDPRRLYRVAATGGTPVRVSDGPANSSHGVPWVLPGGRKVLFTIGSSGAGLENARIAVLDLASHAVDTVAAGIRAVYAPPGQLVYAAADGSVLSQPFDGTRGRTTGPAVAILQGIEHHSAVVAEFTASTAGDLGYVPSGVAGGDKEQLTLAGHSARTPIVLPRGSNLEDPAFAPDGKRIALRLTGEGAHQDIWVFDRGQGTLTRLTVAGDNFVPVWSPDGSRIAFQSRRDSAGLGIYVQPSDGSGAAERMFGATYAATPTAWLRDGRIVVVANRSGSTKHDIGLLTPGDTALRWVAATPFDEEAPAVSPDGRWLAYAANTSGTFEVYVQALSGAGGVHQVSVGGGHSPRFSPDGRTLYYGSQGGIMAARITLTPAFSVASRTTALEGAIDFNATNTNYDVHPRTGELLVILQNGAAGTRGLGAVWIRHWQELLLEMGTRR
jgi:eukaryotic-like serine/threonine-protein kinase